MAIISLATVSGNLFLMIFEAVSSVIITVSVIGTIIFSVNVWIWMLINAVILWFF